MSSWAYYELNASSFNAPSLVEALGHSISPHNVTADLWVIGNNKLFHTQWVQCSYHVSGSYGWAPRYILYALSLFALPKRKSVWILTVALGSVMIYNATAAVMPLF